MNFKKFLTGIPYLGWAVIYMALCVGMFAAILGAVTPELRLELGNYQRMGWLMTLGALGGVVGAMQGGRLAHRYSARVLFLSYGAVIALSVALIVVGPSFGWIALGFFGVSMADSALLTLGHGILANVYSEPAARARVLSMVDVAFSGGTLLTPALVMGLHQYSHRWRLPYELFLIPLGVAVLAFVPRKPFAAVAADVASHSTQTTTPGLGYLGLVRIPAVACCLLAGLFTGYIEWGQYFWYVSYATQAQALGTNASLLGMQCFVMGMVTVRCWQAFFHSDWPLGQKLWRLNVLSVLGLGITVLVPNHGVALVYGLANLLFGMGIGVVFPMLLALAIDAAPTQSSRLSALLMSSVTVGAQLAGLAIGYMADTVGVRLAYGSLWLAGLAFTGVIWQLRPSKANGLAAAN